VQARLYHRPHATFVGGLLAFLLYFSLVNISVDFEYALSKLASAIIGTTLVLGPVLLVLPRAPIFRSMRRRHPLAPATGAPAA
jgi:hypothetical protein